MRSRFLSVGLAAVVMTCLLPACPGLQTINTVTQHLVVAPVVAGATLTGYSGTSFGATIPSTKKVSILSAQISSSSGDFAWVDSLVGSATATEGPVLVQATSLSTASNPTNLDIVDTGDLLPLYPDQDFRIYWTLQMAADPPGSYPDGVTLTFTYKLLIE